MFGRTLIGRAFGIPVYASGLLLTLLAAVALMGLFGEGQLVGMALMLLASVFLHELGHALVARRHGVRVIDIVLGPLVCSARMVEIPEEPKVEASIAVSGPAVNLLLALFGLAALPLFAAPAFGPAAQAAVQWFVGVNLLLGLFNLLPGFPMDGGRLLRSFLARRLGWLAATERAVQIGRGVALALALVGLVLFPRAFLLMPLLVIYLWVAGTRELWMVRQRHGRSPLDGRPLAEGFPFMGAFGPEAQPAGGFPGGPFGAAGPRAGSSDNGWDDAAPSDRASPPPGSAGARRPRTIDVDAIDVDRGGGISEDAVKRLESFPGRLRRPPRD